VSRMYSEDPVWNLERLTAAGMNWFCTFLQLNASSDCWLCCPSVSSIPYISPGQDVDRSPPMDREKFWVDRQSFNQEDNIYCLEKVQINKLNVYLQFMLNYDVCCTYESCLYIFPIIQMN
jgi:hypothetical protein